MIYIKKALKKDMLMVMDFKLKCTLPYVDGAENKLNLIKIVNEDIVKNKDNVKLIYSNFKLVGSYLLINNTLDYIYILPKYQNKKIGSEVLKKLDVYNVYVLKDNKEAINFFLKNGFGILSKDKEKVELRKKENYDNKRIF